MCCNTEMIKRLRFAFLVSLVGCTELNTTFTDVEDVENMESTTMFRRKKPAYWEFPETTTSERPDISAEYCKSVNMEELGANITRIVSAPVRGQAEPLLHSVVLYVLTLHRFIRKTSLQNNTDDIAIRMAKDLIKNKRPMFLDMDLNMPTVNIRVGFEKYEFQHFQWVWEDIHQSWAKLTGILFGETSASNIVTPQKATENEESEELKKHQPYQDIDGMINS